MKRDVVNIDHGDFINNCPECNCCDTAFVWAEDKLIGEYQHGECLKCGHEWNECARGAE